MTTPPDPASLTGPALRDAVAEHVMGWVNRGADRQYPWEAPDGWFYNWLTMPDFVNDPAATRAVEDEIERRGLAKAYVAELVGAMRIRPHHDPRAYWSDWSHLWAVIRATGDQKCRAALAAVRGARKEG